MVAQVDNPVGLPSRGIRDNRLQSRKIAVNVGDGSDASHIVVSISVDLVRLPALAAGRKVIAVDLQGHGRTADIDRPLSVALMADDIAALMMGDSIGVNRAGVTKQTDARRCPSRLVRRQRQ